MKIEIEWGTTRLATYLYNIIRKIEGEPLKLKTIELTAEEMANLTEEIKSECRLKPVSTVGATMFMGVLIKEIKGATEEDEPLLPKGVKPQNDGTFPMCPNCSTYMWAGGSGDMTARCHNPMCHLSPNYKAG